VHMQRIIRTRALKFHDDFKFNSPELKRCRAMNDTSRIEVQQRADEIRTVRPDNPLPWNETMCAARYSTIQNCPMPRQATFS
jgi:hypothetical protein